MRFPLATMRTIGSFTSKLQNRPNKIILRAALHFVTFVTVASIMQPCQMSSSIGDDEEAKIRSAVVAVATQQNESVKFELFLKQLRSLLSDDDIDLDDDECRQRGKPWNSYHKVNGYPRIIVSPSTTQQVSDIMKLCSKHGVQVVPFGGGTSLEGQTLSPYQTGVSIDFRNMRAVLQLNEQDLDVRVQAGLGYVELNEILRPKGLWFPLDPGPGATVGGMCACRCSGSTAVRYGSMRENVLNLTAVLSDGTVMVTGSRARKSSAGYDLTRLLIGSEGTLAVITEATLKLHGIPKVSYALRMSFPSVRAAADTARDTLNCGVTIGRCELLDTEMVRIVNASSPDMAPWPERTLLLYELTGPSPSAVKEQLEIIKSVALKHGGSDPVCVVDEEENRLMWMVRKQCLWAAMSRYPDREAMITDACVPLSRLSDLISLTREALDASWLPAPIIAHAGDGNFHVLLMVRADVLEDVHEAHRLAGDIATAAISMGGTCTGEHGIGVGKKAYLRVEMGEGSMSAMETIKIALDPTNTLNPGKVLDISAKAQNANTGMQGEVRMSDSGLMSEEKDSMILEKGDRTTLESSHVAQ